MIAAAFRAPPIIIDIEASGFGPFSYPIEVGVAMDDGGKYCTLVSPEPHWTHWDKGAEEVHRIRYDLLATYGKPPRRVAEELNALLAGRTVYTDAWVVDRPWIGRLFDESRVRPAFRTSALELILTEPQMAIWHATKDQLLAGTNLQRHRASHDAFLIQQTWLRTRQAVQGGSGRMAP